MRTRDIATAALFEARRPRDPTIIEPRVEIHQAPADAADTARLLSELEKQAEAKIVESVKIASNGFECVVHTKLDLMSDAMTYRAIFKLNGRPMQAEHTVSAREARDWDLQRKVFAALADKVSLVIAQEVLREAFFQTVRARFP